MTSLVGKASWASLYFSWNITRTTLNAREDYEASLHLKTGFWRWKLIISNLNLELITQQSLERRVLTTLPNPTPLIYFFSYIWWEVKHNCPLIFFLNLIQNWSPYRRYHTLFATSLWHGYIRTSEEESMDPQADKMPCQMSTEAALIPVSHFVHHSRTEAFYQRQKA